MIKGPTGQRGAATDLGMCNKAEGKKGRAERPAPGAGSQEPGLHAAVANRPHAARGQETRPTTQPRKPRRRERLHQDSRMRTLFKATEDT